MLDTVPKPMLEVRCPTCRQRSMDAFLIGGAFVVVLCRCKTKYRVDQHETFVITTAASVSRTFDGRHYDGFGLVIR